MAPKNLSAGTCCGSPPTAGSQCVPGTETILEPARRTPLVSQVDVAVVGAGTAGVMAAVGAARAGARVAVIERSASPGGAVGMGLIGHFGNVLTNSQRMLIGGAPVEFLDRVLASGGSPLHSVQEALSQGHLLIHFRHEHAAHVGLEMLKEARAQMWFLAALAAAQPAPDGGHDLIFEAKGGRYALRARQVVDASGEADAAAAAGASIDTTTSLSWGLCFEMTHVDTARYLAYLETTTPNCPEWTPWLAQRLGMSEDSLRKDCYWAAWLDGGRCAWRWRPLIMKAVEDGDFALIRDLPGGGQVRYGWDGFWPEPWHGEGVVTANVCMVTGLDPGAAGDVSRAEVAARSYAFEFLRFLRRYMPGFESATIQVMAGRTVPRGGREIVGLCKPGLSAAAPCPAEEVICLARGAPAGLPLGMFVPKGVDNLLVAGKCAAGAYAVRSSVNCMAMGYSCGILAALAAARRVTPAALPAAERQAELRRHGVLLEPGPVRPDITPPQWQKLPGVPYADTDEGAARARKLS